MIDEHEHIIPLELDFMDPMSITFYILYTPEKNSNTRNIYPMCVGMGIDFENPMKIGVDMRITFETDMGVDIIIPALNPPHVHPYLNV